MRTILKPVTDWVSTKKGMRLTIIIWLIVMIGLSAGPRLNDYKVTNFQSLPDEAHSIIADKKLQEYFPNDQGTPGILVFHNPSGDIAIDEVRQIIDGLIAANIEGIDTIIDIGQLPRPSQDSHRRISRR